MASKLSDIYESGDYPFYFVPWWLGTSMGAGRVLEEHPGWIVQGPQVNGVKKTKKLLKHIMTLLKNKVVLVMNIENSNVSV